MGEEKALRLMCLLLLQFMPDLNFVSYALLAYVG